MQKAQKNRLAERAFHFYLKERLIRKQFHRVLYRPDDLPMPGLMLATHGSWWDGMILFHLDQSLLHQDPYVMIDEDGLARFPFFSRLGAFSINRDSLKDVKVSLNYAKERLQQGSSVWMFPQGEERHQEERPLQLASGATYLAKAARSISLFSFYYSFGHEQHPDIYIRTRHVHLPDGRSSVQTDHLKQEMTRLYDDVRFDAMTENVGQYQVLTERSEPLPAKTERWLKAVRR
ncbi:lysophospholipid acyltransferase family protein [Exiguobacterium sp. s193]|uniref:lysophospholipid acyltransferase family protein n=1 Tax=Exiguobacterium sp. s193 TaxID=2751207 RepID=UPI001BE73616|nr:lysophospholipid acyltransferase family protein [Exiguobacterium sp. s193]